MTLIWRPAYRKQGHFSTWLNLKKKIFENKDKQSLHVQKKVFVPTNSVDRIVEHKLRALQYNHDFT